jgi:hypothetical protein
VGESQVKTKIALVGRCDAAGLHVGAMLQLLKPASAPCPEDPARTDGLTGLESSRFCHSESAELTEPSETGEGVRRCPRPSSSCGSSELRVDGDCARAGDVRDWEDLDFDHEPETWQKISRNATRAQHPPPRGGARLPIEAHAVFSSAIFSIVHLHLVLLAGRVHDEERVEVPFRRCPKGGNPAFLDDQNESEILKSWVPIPILIPVNRGANPGYFPDSGQIGLPRFPGIPAESGWGKIPNIFPIGIGKIRLFSRPNRDGAGSGSGISGSGAATHWQAGSIELG